MKKTTTYTGYSTLGTMYPTYPGTVGDKGA